MNRSRLKKLLAQPLIAIILFALARYLAHLFAAHPVSADFMRDPQNSSEWAIKILTIGLWLSMAFLLVRLVGEFVFFIFRKRKGYEAPSLMRDLFALVAYVVSIALILRLAFPNLSFGALLSGSALLGIILGLALQDTLGNLFAGISLHADKPFQVGDVITVGKFTGVVESITWRAVKVRTFSNHIVLLSNSSIAKEPIEVCPRGNANARIVFFNTMERESPAKVIQIARAAVRECENVLRYMTPVVRIRDFGESGVDYEIKYWLEDYAKHNDTDALVRQRLWYAFARQKIEFGYPVRTIEISRMPAADTAPLPQADGLTKRLSAIEIFSPLTEEQVTRLAATAEHLTYAPGETIIREGEQGSSMFVMHRGRVQVQVKDKGRTRIVNTLQPGDFFGEMALFTGEARTADCIAVDETEVLQIGRQALKKLFDMHPELVESLSQTIAERRLGLKSSRESTARPSDESTHRSIMTSVKRIFGIKS